MTANAYHELSLTGKWKDAEQREILTLFAKQGVPESQLAISWHKRKWKIAFYSPRKSKLKKLERALRKKLPKGTLLHKKYLPAKEWRDKWMKSYKPSLLASRFIVIPEWLKNKSHPQKRIPIYLNPGSSFGSGTHETTRHMIRLLEIYFRNGFSFLDLGTGTGILSIAAAKLGASSIQAIDYDKASAFRAEKNFRLNGSAQAEFCHQDLRTLSVLKKFDFVAANLTTRTLLNHKRKIISSLNPGSYLAISGVLNRHEKEFVTRFPSKDLKIILFKRGRRWIACLYQKANKSSNH